MDPFIGEIKLFAGNFAPRGWQLCDGRVINISTNNALFSILGTMYGGDGRINFALPNMTSVQDSDGRGESRYIICMEGVYPSRG